MTWFFEDDIRSGLNRLALGLRIRVVLVAVGVPLWTWTMQARHPGQATIEGVMWIAFPLTDLLMASGGYRMGARSAGMAMLMALMLDGYAGLIGLSGSVLGRGQVPFAMGAAEFIALIGTFSALAWLRGPVEDVDHRYLERRIYRAMAHVAVSIGCVLIVRTVMWQGLFKGWAALIVAGAVVMLVVLSLTDVAAVFRLAADAEAQLVDADGDPISDAPDRPTAPLPERAIPGYSTDPPARQSRPSRGDRPAIPGYHHQRRQPREGDHD